MKKELINKLLAVYNALDTVSVSGKNNLANLSGSLSVISEVISILNNDGLDITLSTVDETTAK